MALSRYIVLEKPVGQTPLEVIDAWRTAHPEFADVPATYAGRLDPMAKGKLLLLLGDECKKRAAYTGLDKEYEVEVVLGLSTDTGDALGLAEYGDADSSAFTAARIRRALASLRGSHDVPYPAFSSKTVNGKPLFQYALESSLNSISIPTHTETIYDIQTVTSVTISARALRERIQNTLKVVPKSDEPSKMLGADFRQDVIRERWDSLFASLPKNHPFALLTLRVTCASGTYMRTLAERLGKALDTRGFALSIHRTKIGRYMPLGPFSFWRKTY